MAIFLIYDRDNTHPDPTKDQRGCYKRGYVVSVYDDDKPCVIPPSPPFYLIKVTGLSKELAEQYIQSEQEGEYEPGKPITVRRRAWKIDFTMLPQAIRDALDANRYFEIDWAQARVYVRNIKTGAGA